MSTKQKTENYVNWRKQSQYVLNVRKPFETVESDV